MDHIRELVKNDLERHELRRADSIKAIKELAASITNEAERVAKYEALIEENKKFLAAWGVMFVPDPPEYVLRTASGWRKHSSSEGGSK